MITTADDSALAASLARLGPDTVGVLHSSDRRMWQLRGEQTSTIHRAVAGAGLDRTSGRTRRHEFGGGCDAEGLARLIEAARDDRRTAPGPDPDPGPVHPVPENLAASLPGLVVRIAERIGGPELIPDVSAAVTRTRVHTVSAGAPPGDDDRLHLELRIGAHSGPARALRVVSGSDRDLSGIAQRALATADEVARVCRERVGAVAAPTGPMPVVLGPGGPAALVHEVCGHGLEVDVACAPSAAYQPPLGRIVGSPLVTVVDDPRLPDFAPLYRVDDEGQAARRTVLVENGRLVGYLADREGSRRTGFPGTGHGRRLDHTHPALTRMSCTYIEAGPHEPGQALEGITRGLYVRSIVAGETDMSGAGFVARVTESHLIENGRITAPVRGAVIRGQGIDVLREIDVVGDDLTFMPYGFQCNKTSQFPLTVSVGQPTIRIRTLQVHES